MEGVLHMHGALVHLKGSTLSSWTRSVMVSHVWFPASGCKVGASCLFAPTQRQFEIDSQQLKCTCLFDAMKVGILLSQQ